MSILMFTGSAMAQHSDVVLDYDSGKIQIEPGEEGYVFEGDFGDFAGGPYETDDPGFNVEPGTSLIPNDIIGINIAGPLLYHDGSDFAPTSATFSIDDAVFGTINVTSGTTAADGLRGTVGQVDGSGSIHEHINFLINSDAPVGAYGVSFTLSAYSSESDFNAGTPRAGADSDLFYIVFNNGLDEETYEDAVGDFVTLVPEPASLTLFGLSGLMLMRRRP